MNIKWLFPFWKIPLVEKFLEDKILKGHGCILPNTAKKKELENFKNIISIKK